jgi:DUF1680 family protein
MYSLENMMTITGDVGMMDYLEKIAFNALPAQISDDYMARQYYQQANQVMVSRQHRNFVTSYDGTDQCFGILTGYPCCTTNMHQGWPKFVQNLWQSTEDNGLAALIYAPSEIRAKVANGTEVIMLEETDYPFNDNIRFTFKSAVPVAFPLHLRIPAWCDKSIIKINGEIWDRPAGNQIIKVKRDWKKNDVVELILPMKVTTSRWFNNSVGVERGPLVYALKVEEQWKDVPNTDKYGHFREVKAASDWNVGIWEKCLKNPDSAFQVSMQKEAGNHPWNLENAPIELKAKGKKIPEWRVYNGDAGPLPYSNIEYLQDKPAEIITLVPYGCSTLRISEFPVVL